MGWSSKVYVFQSPKRCVYRTRTFDRCETCKRVNSFNDQTSPNKNQEFLFIINRFQTVSIPSSFGILKIIPSTFHPVSSVSLWTRQTSMKGFWSWTPTFEVTVQDRSRSDNFPPRYPPAIKLRNTSNYFNLNKNNDSCKNQRKLLFRFLQRSEQQLAVGNCGILVEDKRM